MKELKTKKALGFKKGGHQCCKPFKVVAPFPEGEKTL